MKVKEQVKKKKAATAILFPPWLEERSCGTLLVFILLGQYKALFSGPSLHRKANVKRSWECTKMLGTLSQRLSSLLEIFIVSKLKWKSCNRKLLPKQLFVFVDAILDFGPKILSIFSKIRFSFAQNE